MSADRLHPLTALSRRAALGLGLAAPLSLFTPARAKAFRAGTDDFVVQSTASGALRGLRLAGISRFLGIPYGADTRGTRFARPQPAPAWQGRRDALAYGHAAPQAGGEPDQSEDCLYLNIWTPSLRPSARLPVMVYIHGGAYNSGSGSSPLTDGADLAARGEVVVVTLNHRLNAFGYLALGRLMPEAFPDAGNAGQWDLILALDWIMANIARFGGDPGRVTLFGQSGGGAKIATLMAMPAAAGKFFAAATMSGQQVTASGPLNATLRARAFLSALGISPDRPQDLLELSTGKIIDALATRDPVNPEMGLYFGPVLDGRALTRHPFWPDAPGQSTGIPMLLGNTHDETRTLIGRGEPAMFDLDWSALPLALARHMRTDIAPEAVIALYRAEYPQYTPSEIFFAATTAGRSWRGQVEEADARARSGAPTWVYRYDLPAALDGGKWGAPHTSDIAAVFGTYDAPSSYAPEGAAARAAGEQLSRAFVALARTGAPAHSGLPDWPAYTLPARHTLIVDAAPHILADPRGAERALFATVPFTQWGT